MSEDISLYNWKNDFNQARVAPINQDDAHCLSYLTLGDFKNEKDAEVAFDEAFALHMDECFFMHKQVSGKYLVDIHPWEDGPPRVDRVLMPTQHLIDQGFSPQPIGVEIKKSQLKIGHVVSQCIDYRHASFSLDTEDFFKLDAIYMFEAPMLYNDIASVATQFRVGSCRRHYGVQFIFAAQVCLQIFKNQVKKNYLNADAFGRKRGHR